MEYTKWTFLYLGQNNDGFSSREQETMQEGKRSFKRWCLQQFCKFICGGVFVKESHHDSIGWCNQFLASLNLKMAVLTRKMKDWCFRGV